MFQTENIVSVNMVLMPTIPLFNVFYSILNWSQFLDDIITQAIFEGGGGGGVFWWNISGGALKNILYMQTIESILIHWRSQKSDKDKKKHWIMR